MRDFLVGAIEYLSSFTEGNLEMPVSIIRAMNGVERIAHIEETHFLRKNKTYSATVSSR